MRVIGAVCLSLVYSSITCASASPIVRESQKLLASDGSLYGFTSFGGSISIKGNNALISAPGHGSLDQGAVYAFEKDSLGTWRETQLFSWPGLVYGAGFGSDVSIFGDYAVVGAYEQNQRGSAFLFRRNESGLWSGVAELATGDPRTHYGGSVTISDGIAAVGSSFTRSGPEAVYLFAPNASGMWVPSGKLSLTAPRGTTGFGDDVAISPHSLLVGAPFDNERGTHAGAAYIFEQKGSTWTETVKLMCDDMQEDNQFGDSVALSGNIALVGAPGSNSAYLFRRSNQGEWHQLAQLRPDDAASVNNMGVSVALWMNYALVGFGGYELSGGAYLFSFDQSGNWSQVAKYVSSDGDTTNAFGLAVGMDAGSIIVGASDDEELTRGAGAAFAFHVIPEPSSIFLAISSMSLMVGITRSHHGSLKARVASR